MKVLLSQANIVLSYPMNPNGAGRRACQNLNITDLKVRKDQFSLVVIPNAISMSTAPLVMKTKYLFLPVLSQGLAVMCSPQDHLGQNIQS
jgi:hypothetical protein